MLLSIIVFILILGLLIFSHEFGHFISAKKVGMKVEEFGFGFPPRLFAFKKGETLYSLNLIPLGGFVRIYGEQRPAESKLLKKISKKLHERAFYNKPIWQRAIVLIMGVAMNLVLAAVVLSFVHGIGMPTIIDKEVEPSAKNIQIQIVGVAPNSPAEQAGLKIGDSIDELKVKSQKLKVSEVEEVQKFVAGHTGEKVILNIQRGNKVLEKTLMPRISPPEGEGPMGIALAKTGIVRYPWHEAIWQGFKTAGQLIVTFVGLFYHLFKVLILKGALISELTGPVGIAVLTSQVTKLGLVYILQLIAIISINLAIINIIPFPALDGGRLLFLAIEKIKGKPVSARVENLINNLGFAFLLALMVLITFRDIAKLF